MKPYISFFLGLLIGGSLGLVLACLLACNRDNNFWRDRIKETANGNNLS